MATRRTGMDRMLPGPSSLERGDLARAFGRGLGLERAVDLDQRLFLALGDGVIAEDVGLQVGALTAFVENAGAHVERLRGDAETLRDRLENLRRGLAHPTLDLAEVRIRDA